MHASYSDHSGVVILILFSSPSFFTNSKIRRNESQMVHFAMSSEEILKCFVSNILYS